EPRAAVDEELASGQVRSFEQILERRRRGDVGRLAQDPLAAAGSATSIGSIRASGRRRLSREIPLRSASTTPAASAYERTGTTLPMRIFSFVTVRIVAFS